MNINHRMEDHLQTKWFFNRGLDTKISLEYPQHLQGEINYYLNKEVLDLPVFGALNDNFVKQLGYGITTQFAGWVGISLFIIIMLSKLFKSKVLRFRTPFAHWWKFLSPRRSLLDHID